MAKIVVLFIALYAPLTQAELLNQLKHNASPYLAMHGDDPVAWQQWQPAVLQRAKKENKLVLISIGYFSCHWCHVMQRESYQDEVIAKTLNQIFIPVKVDRELHPALDAYLIEFVQKTRGYAGWPLNVFVTPEGHPVVGIVYLPKQQFRSLLLQLHDLWSNNSEYMSKMAVEAAAQLKSESVAERVPFDNKIGKQLHSRLLQQVMQVADDMQGGFGEQAKFPMVAQLKYLLNLQQQQPTQPVDEFLLLTLEQMSGQGLRDHIGGGFFRYTVDPDWQTPHFEKMLYDNAQLASVYLQAAKLLQRKDLELIGRETLDFMLRELATEQGAMMASLSAVDDKGIEGGYYLWNQDELKKLLTDNEYTLISLLWGLENAARFEAGYLPHYAVSPDGAAKKLGIAVSEVMQQLGQVRAKLYRARQQRSVPADHKLLAAWNALALSALIQGAQLPQGESYRVAAQKIRNYLVNQLWDGRNLWRARDQDAALARGGLEDYAYAAQALLQWTQFSGYEKDRQLARQWVDIAWQRFYTTTGWRLADDMLLANDFGVAIVTDNPMPSASAVLIATTLELAKTQNDEPLKQRAISALAISQEVLKNEVFPYATQIELMANLPR
ncbi:thioredoxin domain-containing protein [Kaarinaea lacus]